MLKHVDPLGRPTTYTYEATFNKVTSVKDALEHVTTFFYRHASGLHLANIEAGADYRDVRMCVDTEDDLALFARVIGRMDRPHWTYGLEELVRLYRASVGNRDGEAARVER